MRCARIARITCVGDSLLKYALVQFVLFVGAVAGAFFAPYGPFVYLYFCVAVAGLSSVPRVDVKIYTSYYYYTNFAVYATISVGLSLYLTSYTDSAKLIGRFVIEHSFLPKWFISISIRRMSELLSGYASVEEIYGWLLTCCIVPVLLLSIRRRFLMSFFSYVYREVENTNNEAVIDQRKRFYIGFFLILTVMFGYEYVSNYIYPFNRRYGIVVVINLFRGGESVMIAINSAIYFSSFLVSLMSVAMFMAYNNKSKMRPLI